MTTEDRKYNGWTNYETWAVKLWMDNDEGDSEYWSERARETFAGSEPDGTFTQKERAALTLADEIKERHEEMAPEVPGLFPPLESTEKANMSRR